MTSLIHALTFAHATDKALDRLERKQARRAKVHAKREAIALAKTLALALAAIASPAVLSVLL